jgi:hypothetical protein
VEFGRKISDKYRRDKYQAKLRGAPAAAQRRRLRFRRTRGYAACNTRRRNAPFDLPAIVSNSEKSFDRKLALANAGGFVPMQLGDRNFAVRQPDARKALCACTIDRGHSACAGAQARECRRRRRTPPDTGPLNAWLATALHQAARRNSIQACEQFFTGDAQRFQLAISRNQYGDRYRQGAQVLLKLKILIGGDEDVERGSS